MCREVLKLYKKCIETFSKNLDPGTMGGIRFLWRKSCFLSFYAPSPRLRICKQLYECIVLSERLKIQSFVSFRRNRSAMRDLQGADNRTAEERSEYWISIGSVYLCISYLIFTCFTAGFHFLREKNAQSLRSNPNDYAFYLPYIQLYRNLSILCGVFYMSFAFVVYIIQNKNLRKIIVEVLYILFTNDYPPNSREKQEQKNRVKTTQRLPGQSRANGLREVVDDIKGQQNTANISFEVEIANNPPGEDWFELGVRKTCDFENSEKETVESREVERNLDMITCTSNDTEFRVSYASGNFPTTIKFEHSSVERDENTFSN